jgi:hypothetical protein
MHGHVRLTALAVRLAGSMHRNAFQVSYSVLQGGWHDPHCFRERLPRRGTPNFIVRTRSAVKELEN